MIIKQLVFSETASGADIKAICSALQETDSLLSARVINGKAVIAALFHDDLAVTLFLRQHTAVSVRNTPLKKITGHAPGEKLSRGMRDAISILDMAYAFGIMLENQSSADAEDILTMAKELKKAAFSALLLYPCSLFTKKDREASIARADAMVEKGLGQKDIPGTAWTTFLLAELEKLEKKLAESRQPATVMRREAVGEVTDIIHGIHVTFDPDYDSDPAAIELGIKAARVYAAAV